MTIDVHEVVPERTELLQAFTAVRAATNAELDPDDPPPPADELAGDIFTRSAAGFSRAWVATVDDVPAGELTLEFEVDDENRHLVSIDWLATAAPFRGRGVGASLLQVGLDAAAADDRTSLIAHIPRLPEPDPSRAAIEGAAKVAEAWAERMGLTLRLEERCSRLLLSELDEALVERWLDEGRRRTDGYRIVQFVGPAPDEHIDALAEAQAAMSDAPIDDLDYTFPTEDPDFIRSTDAARVARGLETVRTLALDAEGRGAGISEIHLSSHRPPLAWQGDTGVGRDHRGHGLGRWMKAENLRLARERCPELTSVETYNAQSNPWMLDINVAMGFRPHIIWCAHQGDLEAARAAIG